jgi:gamma-glutamyl phosphate reductase
MTSLRNNVTTVSSPPSIIKGRASHKTVTPLALIAVSSELFESRPNVKRVANIIATGSMSVIIRGTLQAKYWIISHSEECSVSTLSIRSKKSTMRNKNTNVASPMQKFLRRREVM